MENQERVNTVELRKAERKIDSAKKHLDKVKEMSPIAYKRKLEEGEEWEHKITEEKDLPKRLKIRLVRCDQHFTPHSPTEKPSKETCSFIPLERVEERKYPTAQSPEPEVIEPIESIKEEEEEEMEIDTRPVMPEEVPSNVFDYSFAKELANKRKRNEDEENQDEPPSKIKAKDPR
jgi:hypothetical protein